MAWACFWGIFHVCLPTLIIEDEQQGEARAAYGKQQLQRLSQELTKEFGKGFDVTNLRNMRRFCQLPRPKGRGL